MQDLGPGEGIGINNSGQVLFRRPSGYSLLSDGQFYNLNDLLIPPAPISLQLPFQSFVPTAINDAGQISGTGYWGHGQEAVLLIPVPEPNGTRMRAADLDPLLPRSGPQRGLDGL